MQEIKSDDLWRAVKTTDGGDKKWYKVAVDYWDKQEASYDGVLGGYGFVSDIDLRDSQTLLMKVRRRCQLLYCAPTRSRCIETCECDLILLKDEIRCRHSKLILQASTNERCVLWVRFLFLPALIHSGQASSSKVDSGSICDPSKHIGTIFCMQMPEQAWGVSLRSFC